MLIEINFKPLLEPKYSNCFFLNHYIFIIPAFVLHLFLVNFIDDIHKYADVKFHCFNERDLK